MKQLPYRPSRGFTLIELLVVIAIIVILAAMLFPIMQRVGVNQTKAVARSQLNQIDTAIKAFQAKFGYYPPDNAASNVFSVQLYYELVGTRVTYPNGPGNPVYVTLDGANTLSSNVVYTTFNVTGFANTSAETRASDEGQTATTFLKDLKTDQLSANANNTPRFLLCSAGSDNSALVGNSRFRYNSSHPTNNTGAFDLWVDLFYSRKTNRISNWSTEPQMAR
jgi:prepilin-type N-terminal cleavage/methylation domain-containing protein